MPKPWEIFDKKIAIDVIKEIQGIIPQCWLFGGTLLGIIRDNKLLPWDTDVDLGIDSKYITSEVIEKLKSSDFKITYKSTFSNAKLNEYIPEYKNKYSKIICKKKKVKIEICGFAQGLPLPERNDQDLLYYFSGTQRVFVIPKTSVYPTIKFHVGENVFNIAKNYEQQLAFIYGEDWKITKPKWYFTADHYLCRERTIIELGNDDKSKWSKWYGRRVIEKTYGPQNFPKSINQTHFLNKYKEKMKSVAENFWKEQLVYPQFGTIKQRRLHELKYLVPKLSGETLLDLGCGDGSLLNCLLELTDFKKYYGFDFSKNLLKNLNPKIKSQVFNVYDKRFSEIPTVDNIICGGMIGYIFEDEIIEDMLKNLKTKKLFLRTPCTLKSEDDYVNTYSKKLQSNYSSKYRTVSNVIKLIEKNFIIESIDRAYPDNIESEYDTKQFYFCARSK